MGMRVATQRGEKGLQRLRRHIRVLLAMAAILGVLVVLGLAFTGGQSNGPPTGGPRLKAYTAQGQSIAVRACDRWSALRQPREAPRLREQDLSTVEQIANDATNHDLEFVILRDHVSAAHLAVHNGDRKAWTQAAQMVDADC
jgi:4-amino-4-deoxy-L-arabinose transferase-like glycosyltransferase